MDTKGFPLFSKLPLEIREMIWKLAIYDLPQPRVHHYSLFNTNDNGVRHSSLREKILPLPIDEDQIPRKCTSCGAPPRVRPCVLYPHSEGYGWAQSNRFRHLWDAGLRTACSDSRRVLLQHEKRRPEFRTPHLVVARPGEDTIQIGVDSVQEILCLEFSPEDLAACKTLPWGVLISRPFLLSTRNKKDQPRLRV